MELLRALKFVQGAVAKKDFAPALTHFKIKDRMVRGFNGTLGICSPIDLDLDVSPKAIEFVKAIGACNETIAMHVTDNGKLLIQSGSFRAFVNCDTTGTFPEIKPEGKIVNLNGIDLLPALKYLEPFIAEDASRPWACSILFDGESGFATNNIVLIEYWLGFHFPTRINIPSAVVKELIRINENPSRLQVSDRRLIFHFTDGRWLSTQLLELQWPDVAGVLSRPNEFPQEQFPVGLFEALEQLMPFTDDLNRCYLAGDHIATTGDASVAGASVAVKCPSIGVYNGKQLLFLREIAKTISFGSYPNAPIFYGDRCRGLIAGIRS